MPYDVVANIKPKADDNNYEEEEEGDNMSAALWKTGIQEPVSSLITNKGTSIPYDVVANIKPIADYNNYEEE